MTADDPGEGVVAPLPGHAETLRLFDLLVDRVAEYAIFILTADGRIGSWNPGARRIKGYTAEEIIGQPYEVFFTEDDRRAAKPDHILAAARAEGQFQEEAWRVRKDGSRFWASVLITALRDDTGELQGYAKITRDLTERLHQEEETRRAAEDRAARQQAEIYEERMRRSRDELDLILRSLSEGVSVLDADGKLVFANAAAAQLCGFDSEAEMLGASQAELAERFEILHEDGTPFPRAQLPGRLALQGKTSSAVIRFRLKDCGEDRWSFVSAAPIVEADGRIEQAVTVFREFTERRQTEQAWQFLAEASALLGTSLDYEATLKQVAALAVPQIADWCGVEILTPDGDLRQLAVAHFDPQRVTMAEDWRRRWPPEPGSMVWQVINSGQPVLVPEITDAMIEASTTDPARRQMARQLGLRSVMTTPLVVAQKPFGVISFVTAESGRRYTADDLILATEISRRASLAIENARAYGEARTAVQVRDNFLSVASHELRTPLSALSILTSSLVRMANQGRLMQLGADGLRERLLKAERQTEQLTLLIDRLLDVSRLSSSEVRLDLEPLDLGEVARDAIGRVEEWAAESGNRIELVVAGRVTGEWDRNRIDQILTNLITNAIKYAPRSLITVAIGTTGSGEVRMTVEDAGPGIAAEHQERIFGQFERAAGRSASGMGLGLWIVKRSAAALGGSVSLKSQPGHGARFDVVVPCQPRAPVQPAAAPRST